MENMNCVMPDYESECKRLTDENNRLRDLNEQFKRKLSDVEAYYKSIEDDANRMRAQLDIVYLIFGRNRFND